VLVVVHHNRAPNSQQKAKAIDIYIAMAHCTDAWITNDKLAKSTHPQPARMLEVVVADTETKKNHHAYHDNADCAANDNDDDNDDDHDGLVLDNPIEIEVEDVDEPRQGFASNNMLVMDAMMMMMIAEEEERAADPPGINQGRAMDEDEKDGATKDGGDNVDDHVPNRRGGRIAPLPPPPRRAHHAGEIIRTWLHDGTATARFRHAPKSLPFPLPEHRQQRPLFAGDGIRAWLAMD
jgi:hypothetical protein